MQSKKTDAGDGKYDKAPMGKDIADALRAPFSFGKLTTVVYRTHANRAPGPICRRV